LGILLCATVQPTRSARAQRRAADAARAAVCGARGAALAHSLRSVRCRPGEPRPQFCIRANGALSRLRAARAGRPERRAGSRVVSAAAAASRGAAHGGKHCGTARCFVGNHVSGAPGVPLLPHAGGAHPRRGPGGGV
jgi:hypothetical protein